MAAVGIRFRVQIAQGARMRKSLAVLAAVGTAMIGDGVAHADAGPVALKGNFVSSAVGVTGTLGSGGSTEPGLIYDATGKGNFNPKNDYLTPGTPHQGFAVTSLQTGYQGSDNDGYSENFGTASPTILTGAAAKGYATAVSWTGSNGSLSVTNQYFLNPGDQRITVSTTLTALTNLSDLAFVTSIDPDPDLYAYGSYATKNQRGNTAYGVNDFVGASGLSSGATLGILNLNANGYAHTTQINYNCCTTPSPADVLTHSNGDAGFSDTADDGLDLAYSIGTLTAGQSASFSYAYVLGDAVDTVGTVSAAPEPGTWMMMILGFGLLGGVMRSAYRKSEEKFTRQVRSVATA